MSGRGRLISGTAVYSQSMALRSGGVKKGLVFLPGPKWKILQQILVEAEVQMNRRVPIIFRLVDGNELLKNGKKCWKYELEIGGSSLVSHYSFLLSPMQCYRIS